MGYPELYTQYARARACVMGSGLGDKLCLQLTLTEMVISDFRGIATIPKHQENKEAHAMLKPVEVPPARRLLFGTNRRIKLEMEDVNCMAAFQLAQELRQAEKLFALAIEDAVKK